MFNFEELFHNFKMNWFFKNPLYFKILCLFEIKESKQNFCAIRCGKQIIEYNPDILETMTVAEIRNLLIAELNRIILRHPYRKKPNSCYDTLWYEASDITIKQEKILKYNFPANHNMEYYYNELKKLKEEDIEISPNGNSSMLGMQTDTTNSDDTNNNESGNNNIKKDSEESKNQKQQSKNEESQKNQEEQNSKETNEKSTEDYSDNEVSDKNEKSFNDKTDDEKDFEQNQTSVKNLKPFEDNENLEEKGVENQSARNTEKSEEVENKSFGASENSDEKTSENKSADNSEKSKEEKTSIIFSLENSENSEEESQNTKENQSKSIDNFDEISQKSINNTNEKNNQESENYQNEKNQNTDINVLLGPTGLWGEDVIQNQRIQAYVVEAIQQKNWGTIPHDIVQQIEIEYKKNYPDCKRILKYLNAKIKQTNRVLTRTKPSRRFGFSQMGSIYKPRPSKLLVFIDSSGSIAPKLLKKFLLTIKSIFSRTIKEIDMFFFDTELKSKEPIKTKVNNMHKIDVIGRGGTNFECIFEYIKKNQNKYDGILIFTDGYAPEVNLKYKLRTKLCWIIYDNEGVQPWMKKIGLCSIMQKKVAINE